MPNVARFSKALFSLHQVDCLKDPRCKPAIGMFVRQATEPPKHWHLTTDYRSKRAAEELERVEFRSAAHYHRWCHKNLRHEHMVPISVVIEMLIAEPAVTEEFIAQTLRTYGLRATIHREEDALLNASGYARRMPDSFHTPGAKDFGDPLARYKAVGLYERLDQRLGESWFVQK